jgi:hypothetical protein
MLERVDRAALRSFGLVVGGIFALIASWPLLFGGPIRVWALVPGTILPALALTWPAMLAPVHRVWMKMGHALGWVNTRIILCVVFYGVFVPMGVFMRARGRDSMRRRFDPDAPTYRLPCKLRPASHMFRQF